MEPILFALFVVVLLALVIIALYFLITIVIIPMLRKFGGVIGGRSQRCIICRSTENLKSGIYKGIEFHVCRPCFRTGATIIHLKALASFIEEYNGALKEKLERINARLPPKKKKSFREYLAEVES